MSLEKIEPEARTADLFHHIDAGFVNIRLCFSFLGDFAKYYREGAQDGDDFMVKFHNRHLLTTIVIDLCQAVKAPTLWEAIATGEPKHLFRSDLRLHACPEVYESKRVRHSVETDVDVGKPINIAYHTEHLTSSTGTMILSEGYEKGYIQSVIGLGSGPINGIPALL